MRNALCVIVTAVLVATSAVPATFAARQRRSPNLLVFVADDVDWRDFGCYGNDAIRTPHIDRLAADGLRFDTAILTTPQCSPTRISVLTGRYAHTTRTEDLHTPLPAGERLIPDYLRGAGYFTGHMQKTHYGQRGADQFDWYSENLSEDFGGFLDASGERPFFLWVGFHDAHRPYALGAIDEPHDPGTVKVPPYLVDTAETRADLALYYDEIARMDGQIGRFLAELSRRGLAHDTLVVFFGDNGRPFPRAKGSLYDAGIGTPLVMRWPAVIEGGRVDTELVSVIDLAPTLLAAAGIETPSAMQGQSMLAVLHGTDGPRRTYAFSERNWHDCDEHMRSVRSARFKLIHNAYLDRVYGNPADVLRSPSFASLLAAHRAGELTSGQGAMFQVPRPEWELYDLKRDPWEMLNVADDPQYAPFRSELAAALAQWQRTTDDFPPTVRRRDDNCDRLVGEITRRGQPPLLDDVAP